jgi:hypothetical protein
MTELEELDERDADWWFLTKHPAGQFYKIGEGQLSGSQRTHSEVT